MRCPICGSSDTRVTDSRNVRNGIRRRRQCLECGHRFTTYERIHATAVMVVKRDNRREEFDREKLAAGVRKACAKRPISAGDIERLVEEIEGEIQGQGEVSASQLGEAVMERLSALDRVAYIRYASVYRDFQDIESFEQAVKDLREGGGTQLTLPHIAPGPSRQRQPRTRGRRRQPQESTQEVTEDGAQEGHHEAIAVDGPPEAGELGEGQDQPPVGAATQGEGFHGKGSQGEQPVGEQPVGEPTDQGPGPIGEA